MLIELFQSVSGHPDREALLDALVCNSASAAQDVLDRNTDHGELLDDAFLTPFLLEALNQDSWRMLRAFREYGYGAETVLKTAEDIEKDRPGLSFGAMVAMASPETIASFRASFFGKDWDPFQSRPPHCDAVFGMVMGPPATQAYWEGELEKKIATTTHSRPYFRRNLINRVLKALYLLAHGTKNPEEKGLYRERWEARLHREVDLSTSMPLRSALDAFQSMGASQDGGEAVLAGVLRWVSDHSPRPDEPFVENLCQAREWGHLAVALRAGLDSDPACTMRALLANVPAKPSSSWARAWDAWRASIEHKPDDERSALWDMVPRMCKNGRGHPLSGDALEKAASQTPEEKAAWNMALTLEVGLEPSVRRARPRL